jgi:hypothetical protein
MNHCCPKRRRRYGYRVEYSGVGKAPGDERGPLGAAVGFASQIAAFTLSEEDSVCRYQHPAASPEEEEEAAADAVVAVFDSLALDG